MQENPYICTWCAKKFDSVVNISGKKVRESQKKYLRPTRVFRSRSLEIPNLEVNLGKICHQCSEKFQKSVIKIIEKNRVDRTLWYNQARNLNTEKFQKEIRMYHWKKYGPNIERSEELILEAIDALLSKEFGEFECKICQTRFKKSEMVIKQTDLLLGNRPFWKIRRSCRKCRENIYTEILELIPDTVIIYNDSMLKF